MVQTVTSHMCKFGKTAVDEIGEGPVYKPTKFMSNSMVLLKELDRRCKGCERHVHLMSGRAAKASIYPKALCRAVCRGVKKQMQLDRDNMMMVPLEFGQEDLNNLEIGGALAGCGAHTATSAAPCWSA